MRRPRGIAQSLTLEEFQEPLERTGMLVDYRMQIAARLEACGHGSQCEVRRVAVLDFVPRERRRDACVGRWAHRVCGGDSTVLGVLVVVDEHTLALLLPPLAAGELRCASFDFARERQR